MGNLPCNRNRCLSVIIVKKINQFFQNHTQKVMYPNKTEGRFMCWDVFERIFAFGNFSDTFHNVSKLIKSHRLSAY